jgi:hypothetical protein
MELMQGQGNPWARTRGSGFPTQVWYYITHFK